MLELANRAGLPLALAEDGRLQFLSGLPSVEPSVRKLEELRPLLSNQTATGPDILYYMYRDVARPADRPHFQRSGLRFDLTVILSGKLGDEFIKTFGHYHPPAPGTELTYPEAYQVISGRAHCLLQKTGPSPREAVDVVFLEAVEGESFLVPPGYGHVLINPGQAPLVMANLVAANFSSVYEPFREARGAAYYELEEDGEVVFVSNDEYASVPDLRLAPVVPRPEVGLDDRPLYTAFANEPGRFAYLARPGDYRHLFQRP